VSRPPFGHPVPGNRWDVLDGVWPADPPTVSVIVLHYDQADELARTARAIEAQTHPASRLEVIVVDDGSPEPPSVPPGWTLLVQEDRGERPGAARNRGAAHATGDVLCFLDADTAPEPDYLRRLTRLPALAPEAVTVGRRRHADFAGVALDAPVREGAAPILPEPRWLADGYRDSSNLLVADDRSYRFVISSVLGCSRWFFTETGGFHDVDGYGGEDWEWGHRAWRAGAIFAHVPDAVAWHDGPEWGARGTAAQRRTVKNDETLRLADLIGVQGSAGHALMPWRAETVIRVADRGSATATFICVDSLLAALPRALVVIDGEYASLFAGDGRVLHATAAPADRLAWPRLTIDVARPVRVDPAGLRAACDALLDGDAGRLTIADADGPLLVACDVRAALRSRRWGDTVTDAGGGRRPSWVAALPDEPDLEAYLGGWMPSPE
jgi:GT2 family glycosyltransferase